MLSPPSPTPLFPLADHEYAWVKTSNTRDRTWPHAQIISYPRDPGRTKYIFSMWAFNERGFFDVLEEYCDFCADYERRTGYRCDLPAVGYAIAKDRGSDFPTLCIDPTSTGGEEWERFLRAYNEFCSARRGLPLFNQTPFLTRAEVTKAFGKVSPILPPPGTKPTLRIAFSTAISASFCRMKRSDVRPVARRR